MLDLKFIIKNKELVKSKLKSRNFNLTVLKELFSLSDKRTELMSKLQNLEFNRNKLSKEIGIYKKEKKDCQELFSQVQIVKEQIDQMKVEHDTTLEKINKLLLQIPNLPNDDVPKGFSEEDNFLIKEYKNLGKGKITNVLPHYEIGKKLNIIDFERTVKISGSRFWSYKGQGAKLVRALVSFLLDNNIENGYEEIIPPVIVNSQTLYGTGQLPKFSDDLFKIENANKWLIPTAEVPLTNFYGNEIVNLEKPIKLTAYTTCFRSEAGSGGKDTKGIIRSHQFHKVELVKIVSKKSLEEEFNKTLLNAKELLEKLQLPYQEIKLCTGDLGFSSEKTVDLEVWLPSENRYREISSVSSFGDFQCRRAKIRHKDKQGNNVFACSINGSALAIDRLIAAILENYQNENGTVSIPKELVKYMNQKEIS